MKRAVIIVMVCVITAGLFTGCWKKEEAGEMQTLRVFFRDPTAPDTALVEAAVSEITREEIGAEIEFMMFGPGEYAEKMPMLLASNEKMDIGFDSGSLGFVDRAKKNAYLDLTGMLETTNKKLYETIPSALWKGVTLDGKIYGVPTYKEIAGQWVAYAYDSILDENNIDAASIKKLADIEPVLAGLKMDPENAGFMIRLSPDSFVPFLFACCVRLKNEN